MNVFRSVPFRSTVRQPLRTLLLLGLILLIVFSFTIRVYEGLIVGTELDRFENEYRAVGRLAPIRDLEWEISAARQVLEQSPLVRYTDNLRVIPAVMDGIYTPDTGGFTPYNNTIYTFGRLYRKEIFSFSELFGEDLLEPNDLFPIAPYVDFYVFTILVDEVLAGLPELVQEGDVLRMALIDYRRQNRHVYDNAIAGERYLVAGQFSANMIEIDNTVIDYNWYNDHPLIPIIYRPTLTRLDFNPIALGHNLALLLHPLDAEESIFLYPVADSQAITNVSVADRLQEELEVLNQNIRTIFLRPTIDFMHNPLTTNIGRDALHLIEGRWIDEHDHHAGNRVAVISVEFARQRDLSIGDLLPVTLREATFANEYFMPDSSRIFPVRSIGQIIMDEPNPILSPFTDGVLYDGIFYRDIRWLTPGGNINELRNLEVATGYITDRETNFNMSRGDDLPHWSTMETVEEVLEIVGIYVSNEDIQLNQSAVFNSVFVPDSIVPETWEQDVRYHNFSFVLNSPADEEQFMEQYQAVLYELGFWPIFIENGWDGFHQATAPIRHSINVGILTFLIILIVVTILVHTLYFLLRIKEYAISRALGMPKKRGVFLTGLPLMLVGMIGIIISSMVGWFFSISRAQSSLHEFNSIYGREGVDLSPPIQWFLMVTLLTMVLYALLTIVFMLRMSRYSELELLQGKVSKRHNRLKNLLNRLSYDQKRSGSTQTTESDQGSTNYLTSQSVKLPQVDHITRNRSNKTTHLLRLIWKRIAFQKARSLFLTIISLGFVIILSFMPFSIVQNQERVEWLFDNTELTGTIMPDPMDSNMFGITAGVPFNLMRDILQLHGETGENYISSYFAATQVEMALFESGMTDSEFLEVQSQFRFTMEGATGVLALNQIERYNELLDDNIQIEFLEGYDETAFYVIDEVHRVIAISNAQAESMGLQSGDYVELFSISYIWCIVISGIRPAINRHFAENYKIIATFDSLNDSYHFIAPLELIHGHTRILNHRPFEFNLDPMFNRNPAQFREAIQDLIAFHEPPYVLILLDHVLREAVTPLERNIEMMNHLYPIILALSFLVATGLTLLILLSSVREIAMIRVMGMSRNRLIIAQLIEKMSMVLLGVILGCIINLILFQYINLLGIVIYILGALFALLIYIILFIRMKPLSLLQVNE